MPDISEIVVVNINRQTRTPSLPGFGIPLIASVHTSTPEIIKTYLNINAVADDFATTDPEYLAASAMFAQDNVPESIKIGKLVANVAQQTNIDVPAAADGTYTVTLNSVAYTYVASSDTQADIVDGLILAIEAGNLMITLTDNGNDFDMLSDIPGIAMSITVTANLTETETISNVNVSSQLATISQTDDDYYFITLTSNTKADILEVAASTEAKLKLFGAMTADASVYVSPQPHIQTITWAGEFVTGNTIDLRVNGVSITQVTWAASHAATIAEVATNIQALASVTTAVSAGNIITVTGASNSVDIPVTQIVVAGGAAQETSIVATTQNGLDVAQELEDKTYTRTYPTFDSGIVEQTEMGITGVMAPKNPGSATWKFKGINGVSAEDTINDSQRLILKDKNCNIYTKFSGVNMYEEGVVASGEYIDVMRGLDWVTVNIKADVFTALVNSDKVPYTDAGVDSIKGLVQGVLDRAVQRNIFASDPAPTVTAPKVADISVIDRGNRLLPDVVFTATLAGAIHKTIVTGYVSV
ncbi:DUF3383 family protein [Candidatus Pacearchaeota archaeon]|nr:DUF3383 family protein [Candidatus Pacearchaeota archaeon]